MDTWATTPGATLYSSRPPATGSPTTRFASKASAACWPRISTYSRRTRSLREHAAGVTLSADCDMPKCCGREPGRRVRPGHRSIDHDRAADQRRMHRGLAQVAHHHLGEGALRFEHLLEERVLRLEAGQHLLRRL